MNGAYEIIQGTSTSQVQQSISKDHLLSSDAFLVSQQALPSTDSGRTYQWHGQILSSQYASRKLEYDSLSSQLFSGLCGEFGFGSMAQENSSSYSLHNHSHNYTRLSVETMPLVDPASSLGVVTVRVGDGQTVVSMPKPSIKTQKLYIGQLKFFIAKTLKPIDCNSPDFDGWVYPDGRALSKEKFRKAFEFFGIDYGGTSESTTFNIPCLTSFMKVIQPTVANKNQSLVAGEAASEVLADHIHNIDDVQVKGTLSPTIKFTNVGNFDKGTACHGIHRKVNTSYTYDLYVIASNLRIVGGSQTTDSTSIQKTTHPSYNYLPVVMYIGVD